MKIIKLLKMLLCIHNYKSYEDGNPKYYFHFKCNKCGKETGMGNFKLN